MSGGLFQTLQLLLHLNNTIHCFLCNCFRSDLHLRAEWHVCRFAITGSEDSTARVWDLHALAQLDDQNHAGKVHTISVTPDGSTAVSVAADGCAMVWDVQSGSCRHTLKGHAGALHWACLASDGRTLLTVAGDRMVKIWDCITGSCSATLPSRRASSFVCCANESVVCCANESAWWSHLVLAGVLVASFRITVALQKE